MYQVFLKVYCIYFYSLEAKREHFSRENFAAWFMSGIIEIFSFLMQPIKYIG